MLATITVALYNRPINKRKDKKDKRETAKCVMPRLVMPGAGSGAQSISPQK